MSERAAARGTSTVRSALLVLLLSAACSERALRTTPPSEPETVSAASRVSPQGCAAALRLTPSSVMGRSLLQHSGSTVFGADTTRSQLGGCRDVTAGPEAWYVLDLSAFTEPVEVHAVVDASFDAVLELRRGACGDTASVDCDRARGIAATGSSLAARLEPGEYWLVVDGASATSSGEFQLQIELDAAAGRCTDTLSDTVSNSTCQRALQLAPLPLQSVLIDEACAPRAEDGDASLWYELDLQQEPRPVLVRASAWTLSEAAIQRLRLYAAGTAGQCGEELAAGFFSRGLGRSNAELSQLLAPGRYRLELVLAGQPQRRAALQLELDRETCSAGPGAQHWQDARPVDPSALLQVLEGNTACNTGQHTPFCAEVDAPEQLYRLDLRSLPGLVRARITVLVEGLGFPPVLVLSSANPGGTSEAAAYCDARVNAFEGPPRLDLTLPPDLYQLVVDGAEPGASGPYRLLVELEPATPSACVDSRIDECVARNAEADCCLEGSPTCNATLEWCGLARATQDCLCRTQPSCCTQERVTRDCAAALAVCNYLCPAFASSEARCLAPP